MAAAHARWAVSDALTLDVFGAEFDVTQFRTAFFAAAEIACPERVGRSVPKRQAEFFHGRLCARAALRAAGSVCGNVGVGAHGEPAWPAGYTGSISHAYGIAIAAVVPGSAGIGLGIDVEEIAKDATLTALLQTTMTAPERALLLRYAGPEGAALATAAFSAKESFYKAVFSRVQRYVEFDAL